MNIPAHNQVMEDVQDWQSVGEFALWYASKNYPIVLPPDFAPSIIEGAISFPIFKHRNFQAELYLFDTRVVGEHAHPFVDLFNVGLDEKINDWGMSEGVIYPATHNKGGVANDDWVGNERYSLLLAMQKFHAGVDPCTISAYWKGRTCGQLHESVILKRFPNAFLKDRFADVTIRQN